MNKQEAGPQTTGGKSIDSNLQATVVVTRGTVRYSGLCYIMDPRDIGGSEAATAFSSRCTPGGRPAPHLTPRATGLPVGQILRY